MMKNCKSWWAAALLLVVLSCQQEGPVPVPEADPTPEKEQEPQPEPTPELVHHVIDASMGADDDGSKATLNPLDDGEVLWAAGEHVAVFVGDTRYEFTGTNAAPASSARFEGDAPADLGTYVMLYPYSTSAVKSGSTVSTTLSAAQTGAAGTYADGTIILAGTSSTASVECKHVCSGLRFKPDRADVTAVTLQGNNGERIAGNFSFSFDGSGVPVAGTGTEEVITLTAPGGGTFQADQWYYIVSLPCVFSKGITLTAYAGSWVGTLELSTENLTFSRGHMKQVSSLNSRLAWETLPINVYYGPQNSFCTRRDTDVVIDVSPRQIAADWQRGGVAAPSAPYPTSAEVLWGSATCSLVGNTLTMRSASEGNSLIAIKNGSTVLWSYLLWVTESAPAQTALPSGATALATLGGDLLFQWGRKDPLQAPYAETANQGDAGLAYSIAHPTEFIDGVSPHYDWSTGNAGHSDYTQWYNLWGASTGSKTVWDPCPQGWRVPTDTHFRDLEDNYIDYGFDNGEYYSATPNDDFFASCLFVDYYPNTDKYGYELSGAHREVAYLVRCVAE